jgi:hypothetical protein
MGDECRRATRRLPTSDEYLCQAKLAAQAVARRCRLRGSPALLSGQALMGLAFDYATRAAELGQTAAERQHPADGFGD